MRNIVLLTVLLVIATACSTNKPEPGDAILKIKSAIALGELTKAGKIADSLSAKLADGPEKYSVDSLAEIIKRIPFDFRYSEDQVMEQLRKRMGDAFSESKIAEWAGKGWLENRLIDGEKRYFSRAASNLMLLSSFHLNRAERDSAIARDNDIVFRKKHTGEIIAASVKAATPVVPVSMKMVYTITVEPDAVPEGETIKCWLPYPKEMHPRQSEVYLLGVSSEDFILAPDTCTHRTIYMEQKAEKGKTTVFSISYSYISKGQSFEPGSIKAQPYDRKSDLYKKYTAEQLPQICFTPAVRKLTDSITVGSTDPVEIVRKIYYWFNQNIPWAGALEYSIMPNIPEYVITNRKGDCGMQTFLFMSMLRYKGIPVKWQSGWMTPPGSENLHDWCEVYYEGTGWVPADISYNLQFSPSLRTREFYITGIDSYRMIINDGVSGDLYPPKKYLRSEPYDFQRGEVEWAGGNLYFDKWDYDMKIEYTGR